MRNLTTVCLFAWLLVSGTLGADDKSTAEATLINVEVGATAPTFEGLDERGQAWISSDHVGQKYVVVYFYPADFTTGCTKQAEMFRDTMNLLADQGVAVVGVSGDAVENHRLFKDAWK